MYSWNEVGVTKKREILKQLVSVFSNISVKHTTPLVTLTYLSSLADTNEIQKQGLTNQFLDQMLSSFRFLWIQAQINLCVDIHQQLIAIFEQYDISITDVELVQIIADNIVQEAQENEEQFGTTSTTIH